MNKQTVVIAFRVTVPMRKMIDQYLAQDTHKDTSEFVRDACRQKIQRDAPTLFRKLFHEKTEEAENNV